MNQLGLGVTFALNDLGTGPMARAGQSMVAFDQTASRTAASVNRSGAAFMAGAQIFSIGAGILTTLGAVSSVAGEFEASIAAVGAVSNATAAELELLSDAAIQAGIRTQFSPTQAAVGLGDLAQAGYAVNDSLKLLNPVLALAAGSIGDLTPSGAAGLAAQTLKAFSIPVEEAGITVDRLLQSANAFALRAGELPLALGVVARGAGVMNQSLSESLAAFGLVKNVVPGVERASTSVAVAMERMVRPETQKALHGIGVEVISAEGKFRPFLSVIEDLMPALDSMSEAQRGAFLNDAFGSEAMGGIGAMLKQLSTGLDDQATGQVRRGADAIRYLRDTFADANVAGTAKGFSDALLNTFEGQKKLFKGSVETLAIVMGKPLTESLRPMVEAVTGAVNALIGQFMALKPETQGVLMDLALWTGAAVSAAGGILMVGGGVGYLVTQMRALGLTTGMFGWMAVGIAAVSLAVMAYQANIGGFGDYVDRVAGRVRLAVEGLSQLVNDGGFSGEVLGGLNQDTGLKDFVVQLYVVGNVISEFLGGAWAGIKEGIEAARPTFENMGLALTRLATTLGLVKEGVDPIKGALDLQSAGESGRSFGTTVAAALETVVKVITAVVNIVDGFVQQWDKLPDVTGPFAEGLSEVGSAVTSVLTDLGLMNSAAGSTDSTFAMIGAGSAKALHAAISLIGTAFSVVGSIVKDVVNIISGAIKIVVNLLRGDFSGAWEGVKQVMLGATQAAADVILGLVEVVAEAIDALFGFAGRDVGMSARVKDIRDAMKNTSKYFYEAAPTENTGDISPERAAYMANKAAGSTSPSSATTDVGVGPAAAAAAYYASPAATDQAAVTQALVSQLASTTAPDVDGLNASISSLRAAKEGPVTLSGDLLIDGERAGRLLMSASQSAAAASGAPVGLVVE